MLQGYRAEDGYLRPLDAPLAAGAPVVWFDLYNPSEEEEKAMEALVGINVPTREEMEEIEDSSRLYHQGSAAMMTAMVLSRSEDEEPILAPVTFILLDGRLITVRYQDPKAFQTFPQRAEKSSLGCVDGETVMTALLDAIVDRLADILEMLGRDNDKLSRGVFRNDPNARRRPDFAGVLRQVGRQGDLVSNVLSSLVSIERMIEFLGADSAARTQGKEGKSRIRTLARDTHFLTEHANFLSQKITFLLDATLGMIGIQQNATIKIFSVAAVVLLPPTLIASIYGMNFAVMPELAWAFGYPFALGLMVASAVLSFWIFKREGWL